MMIKALSFIDVFDTYYSIRLNEKLEKIQRSGGIIKDIKQMYCGGGVGEYPAYGLTLIIYEDAAGAET